MRRATVTLTDELEALLDAHLGRLDAPPSLNALVQAALRSYLGDSSPSRRQVSVVGEAPFQYDAGSRPRALELDPESELLLRQAAAREGVTVQDLATAVLRQYARGIARPAPRGLGAYRSGRDDVASRSEEILRAAARKRRR